MMHIFLAKLHSKQSGQVNAARPNPVPAVPQASQGATVPIIPFSTKTYEKFTMIDHLTIPCGHQVIFVGDVGNQQRMVIGKRYPLISAPGLLVICSTDTPSKLQVFILGYPLGEMFSGHGAPTEWKSAGGSHTTHGSTTLHKTAEMLEPEVLGQNGFKHFHVTLFPLSPI